MKMFWGGAAAALLAVLCGATRAGEDKHNTPFLELAKRVDQAVAGLKQTGPTVTIED